MVPLFTVMTRSAIAVSAMKMLKRAPMGDPLDIVLRGYELTLRIEDAKNIEIEKTEENDHI